MIIVFDYGLFKVLSFFIIANSSTWALDLLCFAFYEYREYATVFYNTSIFYVNLVTTSYF